MDDKILYILDSESISEKILNQINSQKNCFIVCLNHSIEKKIQKLNVKILYDRDFLKKSVYREIDELTYNISREWCTNNNLKDDLVFHGINLGLTLQNELCQNLLKYIHRIFLIQKILQEIQPTKVFTTHSNGVLDSIPLEICVSKNIKTEILQELPTKFRQNRFDKKNFSLNIFGRNLELNLSNKQFTYLKKCYEFYASLRYHLMTAFEKENKGKKSILFLDFNLNWHETLFEKFHETGNNIFCLNNRRPLLWNYNSLKIAKKFKIKKVNISNNETEIESEYNNIIKNLNQNFQNNYLNQLFMIQNFNLWKYFQIELLDVCKKRFKNTMNLIVQIEKFLESTKIDLVWTGDDWGNDKAIVNICQKKNIPVCLFLAGGFHILKHEGELWPSFSTKQRIADKMFVWGENDMQNIIECGIEPSKLVIGGAPRYDKTFFEKEMSEEYILILTSAFPSSQYSYFNSVSAIQEFQILFERTLHEAKKFNKKIIIKRHPTQGFQEIIDYNEIIARIVPEAIILKNANTLRLISKASLIISAYSTVLEESIILGKPIILLPYLKDSVATPFSESGAVIEISNPEQLQHAIHECLFEKDTRKKLQEGRKKFLERVFSFKGNAADKHVEISLKLIKNVEE